MSGVELRLVLDDDQLDVIAGRVAAILRVEQPIQTDVPAYFDTKAAAVYLGCSEQRVRKLIARRKVPFHQEAVGCRITFARHDLDQWMAAQRRV